MKFIEEKNIEAVIDEFEKNEDCFFKLRQHLIDQQLAVAASLTDEGLDILKDDEYDLLWFVIITTYGAIRSAYSDQLSPIDAKLYEKREEENWSKWNATKGKDLRERLTPFFEGYPQEDLLAFIEDSIENDEEVMISSEGQEVIFVLSKTMIDCFHEIME